ncbi:MAG: hypothetical protein KGD68_11500 [Candidatus Lokiarchaeota archaeon]|nr:hypothetical protein [Candidatus Lokiarchaeota archaeon]
MGETEWKHAGWVSSLGKWAWIILFALGIIRILYELAILIPTMLIWEEARAAFALLYPGVLYTVPNPIAGLIWPLIGGIISIIVSLFIIRPKFSKPCGEKDWETLYGWTLKFGSINVPWMFIWGIIFMIFGWYYVTGAFVMLPAIMLIWAGPREYNWNAE